MPPKPTSQVLINTFSAVKEKLLRRTDNASMTRDIFGNKELKSMKVPVSLALNFFLYYVTARGLLDKVNYKVKVNALFQFIDYCQYNYSDYTHGFGNAWTAIKCGAEDKGTAYFFSLMTAPDNTPMTLGSTQTHTSFQKTATALVSEAPASKRNLMRSITLANLKVEQKAYRARLKEYETEYLLHENSNLNNQVEDNATDVTYSEDSEGSDVNEFVGPKSQRPITPPRDNNNNNNNNVIMQSFDDEADVSDFLPPAEISTLHLNEEDIHPHLVESLNNDNMLTSLLENEEGDSNTSKLTESDLARAESTVLNESVVNVVRNHHMKRANDYSAEQFNDSFLKALSREEARANSRKRRGMSYTGTDPDKFDLRNESKDIRHIQSKPARSFTNQDDDYIDYAFYGYIREAGTVINDIMTLPKGYDFNSERRGNCVYIRAIHFRNTFTHITGSKASGRMVIFASDKEYSHPGIFYGRTFNTINTEDVLQKSVTMYAGDLEEAEAIDAFYNPTIMSQYDFRNVILGTKFEILYDYYADLNTQAVKGVVGEDIESVDSVKTKWVKIDDLDIPFFYEGDNKVPTRGILGIVFMGDYFGGEIETNLTMRVFYNSK